VSGWGSAWAEDLQGGASQRGRGGKAGRDDGSPGNAWIFSEKVGENYEFLRVSEGF